MKIKMFKQIRFILEYWLALTLLFIFKLMPYFILELFAWSCGRFIYLLPTIRKITVANISAAMPELTAIRVNEIARKSLSHMILGPLEFAWMASDTSRIEKYTALREDIIKSVNEHHRQGEGLIYVNPHLGNWEVSSLMGSYYTDIKMGVVAKKIRNPYLNKLFSQSRAFKNTRLIYAKGAIRGSLQALRDGLGVGILIDQNTKVRDGGIFVDFFGIPVPCSPAPFILRKRIKNSHIYYATTAKVDGCYVSFTESLSKDFDDYVDDKEVIQELMDLTERYIRQFPEQYLWLYKRFQHIPKDTDEATRQRYPFYAKEPSERFYRKKRKKISIDDR